eukprot:5532257-Karenia_brevis.AAC.1
MSLCLRIGKGRTSSQMLRFTTRELTAHIPATNTKVRARWWASERSIADGLSRFRRPDESSWNDPSRTGRRIDVSTVSGEGHDNTTTISSAAASQSDTQCSQFHVGPT